jgi:OmcA/MtrC family decaheme c-type cytochrome
VQGNVAVDPLGTGYSAAKAPAVGSLASPPMPANPALFPAGAKMRTVALQGYFTQVSPAAARHGVMVTKAVSGEERRLVVDSAKCAQCHEYFEGHGGNRNYNMDGCTVCHVPNLSSSGTIINDPTAPEASQNLKDMVHGIHAGLNTNSVGFRTNEYMHTRSKSGINTVYSWGKVKYPNELKNCESCHKPGTYGTAALSASALASVDVTPVTGLLGGTVFDARVSLPNATDKIISPYSAACVSCHDGTAAKAHMTVNGGVVSAARGAAPTYATTESCVTCHGGGKAAGVDVVHK